MTCKESTRQYAVDDPPLSCKQQVGGSSPPASSKTAGYRPATTRTIAPSTLSPATTLVSGLPRQVGTDGNFQVFEVTAHQRELVARNAVKEPDPTDRHEPVDGQITSIG